MASGGSNYRFQDGVVDPQIATDLAGLNGLDESQVQTLVTACVSFLSTTDSEALMETMGTFAQTAGVSAGALKSLLRSLLLFLKGATNKTLSATFVKEDLLKLGVDDDKAAAVASVFKDNLVALSRTQVDNTLLVNKLIDMEWKFGATASSSELDAVGRTFLQLKVGLDKGSDSTETVAMELSLPQFYEFLQEMEKAKASLDYFT